MGAVYATGDAETSAADERGRDALYRQAVAEFGPALSRLARGYEREAAARSDLLQEIHVALWQSFGTFDGRCSLRTWVYRVAHNVGASHIQQARRRGAGAFVALDEIEDLPAERSLSDDAHARDLVARVLEVIHRLKPIDRQIMLLYLEGLAPDEIAEIVGTSAGNVAVRTHRVRRMLQQRFAGDAP